MSKVALCIAEVEAIMETRYPTGFVHATRERRWKAGNCVG